MTTYFEHVSGGTDWDLIELSPPAWQRGKGGDIPPVSLDADIRRTLLGDPEKAWSRAKAVPTEDRYLGGALNYTVVECELTAEEAREWTQKLVALCQGRSPD
jgi:hypothetical protein